MDKEQLNIIIDNARFMCSKSEKCRSDVAVWLKRYELNYEEKAHVIEVLVDENYVDNTRYAAAFVADKFRFNKWGRIKIRYELLRKKIDKLVVEEALAGIDEVEYRKTARILIFQRKFEANSAYEYRQKMMRYMFGKGFEPEIIDDLLNEIPEAKL